MDSLHLFLCTPDEIDKGISINIISKHIKRGTRKVDEKICLKQYLTEGEYEELLALEYLCTSTDKINLKLELNYKRHRKKTQEEGMKEINEFLYYFDDEIIAYVGISSFGGQNTAEISGMTHPQHRRKGIFRKIFQLAIEECNKRHFNKILLLADGQSESGIKFIESVLGEYAFSEYRMKMTGKVAREVDIPIKLRKATNQDIEELVRQDTIYFNQSEPVEYESLPEEDESRGEIIYLSEVEGTVVGKIKISYAKDALPFISGFGILPKYRNKRYGEATLIEAIKLINDKDIFEVELDVEAKNSSALNIYKSCGFELQSAMNYYYSPVQS